MVFLFQRSDMLLPWWVQQTYTNINKLHSSILNIFQLPDLKCMKSTPWRLKFPWTFENSDPNSPKNMQTKNKPCHVPKVYDQLFVFGPSFNFLFGCFRQSPTCDRRRHHPITAHPKATSFGNKVALLSTSTAVQLVDLISGPTFC